MARCLRIQFPGAFYHVTGRGNERRAIFSDDRDRRKFVRLLPESLKIYQVILHAYVLMANHFHLVIETPKGNLSEFMRHFNICYTGWYNFRHQRCGHLYQGRFKAFLIEADAYLLAVSRYVHLNPVPERCKTQTAEPADPLVYRWSSLPGYLDEALEQEFVEYDLTLGMIGGRVSYREFMEEGLRGGREQPFKDLKARVILGSDEFVAQVKDGHATGGSVREQPSYRELMAERIEPERVLRCVAEAFGLTPEGLRTRMGRGVSRGIACELLYRYSGLKQSKIGQLLGRIDYTTVSHLRRELKGKMERDEKVCAQYRKVEDNVRNQLPSPKI